MAKVIGICMTKDEADIIRTTVEHMLTQVDEVIVADNGSTDGTREILESLPIVLVDDPDPAYYQSKKMTNLARMARTHGAEWIVPFDSDEIWYSPFGKISEILNGVHRLRKTATADLYDHVTSSEDDLSEINPVKRIGWRRRDKGVLPKVACRWAENLVIEQGNHGASYGASIGSIESGLLVIRHFPYRSGQQFCNKARNGLAAYEATDLPDFTGAHWRGYGAILRDQGEEALIKNVYETWFHLKTPRREPTVIFDPAPVVW